MNATLKELVFGTFATALCVVAGPASADLLWDNNIEPDGFNGRAISPPGFPNIRVADDFIVPDGVRWVIQGAHFDIIEDAAWVDDGLITVTFYADTGNGPGDIIAERTVDNNKMFNNRQFFDRDDYTYWADFSDDPLHLRGGTYWVGVRSPGGGGAGTNYWLTSDGGPDGAGTSTTYFSQDGGDNWNNEGAGWQFAFELTGVPAPGALALLGLGGLVGARRSRHTRRQLTPVQ